MAKKKEKVIEPIKLSAVIYTDGSAQPNPGYGGWGIHGYTYDYNQPIDLTAQKKNILTEFGYKDAKEVTDGNLKCFRKLDVFNGYGTADERLTDNIAMEFKAVEKGVELALEKKYERVTMHTDCQIVINSLTHWYDKWKENGFVNSKGEPVKMKETILRIKPKFDLLGQTSDFSIHYVKGHSGNKGNDATDALAKYGSVLTQHGKSKELIEFDSETEKVKVDYSDFFSRNRWYFLGGNDAQVEINPARNGWHWYYVGAMGKGKKDDDFGMNQPDGFMSIVLLKQPEPVLEKVQSVYKQLCKHDYTYVVTGRLDTVLSPACYQDIMKDDIDIMCEDPLNKTISLPSGKILAKEYNPAHLSFVQMEKFSYPMQLLDNYLGFAKDTTLTETDITDLLVEKKEGKKASETKYQLKDSVAKNNCLRTEVKYFDKKAGKEITCPITLTLKTDLPDKPHLQKLIRNHGDKASFKVITHRLSDEVIGYAFVVDSEDAKAIWCSMTLNSIFKKSK